MKRFLSGAAVALAVAVQAWPAAAQTGADAVMASAAVCAPGPSFDAIATRALGMGWAELRPRDALRLQSIPDKTALIRGWALSGPEGESYLLLETAPSPRPRRLSCELIFPQADPSSIQTALSTRGFDDALDAPRLEGPLPAGGRFAEWAAPDESGWKTITLSVPIPPKRGPALNRIRFSGVER